MQQWKKRYFLTHTCRSFSPGYDTSAVSDMRIIMSSTSFPWLCSPKTVAKTFPEFVSGFSSGGIKYVQDHLPRNQITACTKHKFKHLYSQHGSTTSKLEQIKTSLRTFSKLDKTNRILHKRNGILCHTQPAERN